MSFLQKVDRALARNHGNQSRLCHVSGGSTAIPGNSNRTVSARRCLYRTRWQGLLCCRSGLQVPAISIVEEMAGLELRSCSRLRVDLRNGLQIHRAASQPRIDVYSSVVGQDVRPPTYFWARRWFLRILGLVYLIAFVSLWVQVDGLVGTNGMSPVSRFLPAARQQLGSDAYSLLPTLCWFNSSNAFLHFLCGGGAFLSLLLILGIAPALLLVALFVFYLSLTIAGQVFLSFQWDVLLLETG